MTTEDTATAKPSPKTGAPEKRSFDEWAQTSTLAPPWLVAACKCAAAVGGQDHSALTESEFIAVLDANR